MRISSNTILLFTASIIISSSNAFTSFGTAFRTSSPKTNLNMGLFENAPAIMHNDASTAFGALSHLALDIDASVASPQQTACLRLIESISQVFGLLRYCSSNQCIQSDELMCQTIKIAFSFFLLMKTAFPAMKVSLNCVIKPDNYPLSSRDRQACEELFEPIGL